ncbi:PLP-dependent aminotransferase family protein [Sinorhizobium meliloti]|uniref:aminotransferase-like domain-containing protein n=1 Tax=Rhizobium meliloti TaxID=382 RepID=UPI000FD89760|nr:PLP-dependent aminotransferase family protein [Sinorhizobium meliloti]RVG26262.1 PLP-dependent aminotransferase family protein [Sinorhizobium meliloti]
MLTHNHVENWFSQSSPLDMTRTMPPNIVGFETRMRGALEHVARQSDFAFLIQRHRFFGSDNERNSVAKWLARRLGDTPDIARTLITGGTQNTLMILLRGLVGSGGVLATEKFTYAAIGQLGRLLGIEVVGIELDDDGLVPESLEAACQQHNVVALYCNPTCHNPTTSIMSSERRLALAEIAERFDITIFEDDVHGAITDDAPPPLATFAPDRTWYIMSTSKLIGMGLRAAFIVGPNIEAVANMQKKLPSVSAWFVPGMSAVIVADLIDRGDADEFASRIRAEVASRHELMKSIIQPIELVHSHHSSLHIWVDLPARWTIHSFVEAAGAEGITLRNPAVFATAGFEITRNIRLSLVAPKSQDDLSWGLERINRLLRA